MGGFPYYDDLGGVEWIGNDGITNRQGIYCGVHVYVYVNVHAILS